MSKYCFKKDSFYNYTVRSTTIDNTDMYLDKDVIHQYNIEHNTNKSFKDWLRRIDTYELLNTIRKEKGLLLEPTDNFVEDFNKHGDIPEVFIKIKKNEYLVNGALLHDILIWLDPKFAINVCKFIKNLINYSR